MRCFVKRNLHNIARNYVSKCILTLGLAQIHIGYCQTYTYDLGGRLTSATYTNGSQVQYTYDAAGNISNVSASAVQNINPPSVTILNQSGGSTTTTSPVSVSGTAMGGNQVIAVYVQVNSSPRQLASSLNGWTNWNTLVALVPGTNVVTVYAEDKTGSIGSNQFSVNYAPPPLWSPTQLGTNLTLWLDASNPNSILLNGNTVRQWNDLSGNGNNVANANTSTQPVYQANGLNNLPTINFFSDGLGLFGSGNFGVSGSSLRALAAVMNGGMIGTGTPAPTSEAFGFDVTPAPNIDIYVPYFYGSGDIVRDNPGFAPNTNIYFGQYYDGMCSGYVNGGIYGSNGVAPNTVPGPIQLGTRSDGQSRAGKLSEIIYVNTGLSILRQQELEGYLAWKWGLETNLPANHPYRYAAPTAPSVTITSPVVGATVSNSSLTINGTASDSTSGLTIEYQVNGGPWLTAVGTANWQIALNLSPGTSYIQIYATDAAGNTSPIDGFSVTYTPATQTQSGEVQSEPLMPGWGVVGLLVGVVAVGVGFLGRRARPIA